MKVGDRIRLKRDADRFPYFIAKAGLTGTIVEIGKDVISAKMDQPLQNCSLWDNCVIWTKTDIEPNDEIEIIMRTKTAKTLLEEAVLETGWNENSQISVLCDFIDQTIQPKILEKYLYNRVEDELELEMETEMKNTKFP